MNSFDLYDSSSHNRSMISLAPPPIKLVASLCILTLALLVSVVDCARSAPDIAICETYKDNVFVTIDCLSGPQGFCCIDKAVTLEKNIVKWSKKCCSESEYVQQNWHLFMSLVVFTMFMTSLVIVVVLASFGTIIMTEKAARE